MKNEPNGIAVAGDWHGNTRFACSAIRYAQRDLESDTIIHVGDFGYNFEPKYLNAMEKELEARDMYLYFVDGNHENFHILYTYEIDEDGTRPLRDRIIHLPRGHRWTWNKKTYLAMGGAASIDYAWRTAGVEWWPEEYISVQEVENACNGGYADIMICHDCPDGVDIPVIRNNPMGWPAHAVRYADSHRQQLRVIVDEVKPLIIFHGHYHDKYKAELIGKDYRTDIVGLDCETSVLRNMTPLRAHIE